MPSMRSPDMNAKSHKKTTRTPAEEGKGEEDDLWTWVIIGLIFATVTLALYGPLVWTAVHS
jgi:hypothetical protein